MGMPDTITDGVRAILREHGRLAVDVSSLADESNLYEAGLTSHAGVSLMLALEERFDIEFPERMLRRGAFASIAAIRAGLEELMGAGA
jgi:acyl carrier protein